MAARRLIALAAFFLVSSLPLSITAPAAIHQHALVLEAASSKLLHGTTADAEVQGSALTLLRGSASASMEALNEAEADAEMGTDLGMDLALETARSIGAPAAKGGDKGPATLAEYCAGPTSAEKSAAKIKPGTRVMANWEEYGTHYPGKVKEKNSDGTVDIAYDDGFTENNVDPEDFKVPKKKGKSLFQHSAIANVQGNPQDDPACKLQDFLSKLQKQLKDLNKMVSQWMAAQRAKMAQGNIPKPPSDMKPVAAPSAAPPAAPATAGDLEQLKQQLADRDEYITELEKQAQANNKELEKYVPAPTPSTASGITTVDDLIAQYKARIAERDSRIDELLQVIRDQEQEFARLSSFELSLKDIDDAVTALEQDVAEGKKKRDELKKEGSLDPELRAVIDSIIKALDKIRKRVDNLIALEAKAKAEKEKAEREAEEAAEAARKKAEEEGRDPDKAAGEAAEAAKKKAKDKAREADLETMKAAQEVDKDLKEAEKGATKLDTGLHPHGEKWWRYRYEHSYIESLIMIFICLLMLFWSEVVRHTKKTLKYWAESATQSHFTDLEEESHGGVYVLWLHILGEQMMVCLLVYMTVWLIAKTKVAEIFPLIVQPSEDMHVPHTAEEYRHLAVDICTIFCFAIVFYFSLMFPVAHDARRMSSNLELFEKDEGPRSVASSGALPMGASSSASGHVLGSVGTSAESFAHLRNHFISYMRLEMTTYDDPIHREISQLLRDDLSKFPLWMYLKINVRKTVSRFFKFDWKMWLPVMCLFLMFMLCHRFAHMGYVRIMGCFALLTLGVIVAMGWFTKSISAQIMKGDEAEPGPTEKSIHQKYNTESWVLGVLQFTMFIVCYGVARMICQPWMWELHFWPVLILSVVALLSAVLFVWLVSPVIPSFCAAMSVPPYTDEENLKIMLQVANTVAKTARKGEVVREKSGVTKQLRRGSTSNRLVLNP